MRSTTTSCRGLALSFIVRHISLCMPLIPTFYICLSMCSSREALSVCRLLCAFFVYAASVPPFFLHNFWLDLSLLTVRFCTFTSKGFFSCTFSSSTFLLCMCFWCKFCQCALCLCTFGRCMSSFIMLLKLRSCENVLIFSFCRNVVVVCTFHRLESNNDTFPVFSLALLTIFSVCQGGCKCSECNNSSI